MSRRLQMGINREKYENAILYFTETVPDLGKTKLYKLLYFLDFDHFEKHGTPVTEDLYHNKDLGPVPMHAEEMVKTMESKGLVKVVCEQVIDSQRYRLQAIGHHNPSVFKPSEIEMLCAVAEKWSHHTASEIVAASHGEAPWLATRKNEIIPYALAYYRAKFEEQTYIVIRRFLC
jgi:uncharacterized phage-associated protein